MSHENNFDISFRVILLLPQKTDLCLVLMTNTKCIVYRFQALKLNPIEYLRFINCYGKANRKTHALAQRHLIGHCQWANRKRFLSVHSNIWNSNVSFYNKTTCLLRCRCFNRYLLLLLFSIISPWFMVGLINFKIFFLKILRLGVFWISGFSLFHSIVTDRKKVFLKKLCLTLKWGVLSAFLVE